MKFVCLGDSLGEPDALKREYKSAVRFGEARLSGQRLFYRYFVRVKYVSCTEIRKAYLREESGESGEFLLKEFYLMLETTDGTLHKLRMEREVNVRAVLAELGENYPGVSIGHYNRPGQSK